MIHPYYCYQLSIMSLLIFCFMLLHQVKTVPCGIFDYQCKFEEPTCSCNIISDNIAKSQVYTQSSDIVNTITYNQIKGMRIDSPSQISFGISISKLSSQGMVQIKSNVRLQNFVRNKNISFFVFFRYFGTETTDTLLKQLLSFQTNQTSMLPVSYNSNFEFLKQISQNSMAFEYTFNLKQILYNRIQKKYISPNLYVSGIDFMIVVRPESTGYAIRSMQVTTPKLTIFCETRNATIVSSENLTIFQEVYSDSSSTYTNLTRLISPSAISQLSIYFKYNEANYSTLEALKFVKSYDYIGIGFINNSWLIPSKQYNLPFQVSAPMKLLVTFNYLLDFQSNQDQSTCMVCFSVLLSNRSNLAAQAALHQSAQTVKIMVCSFTNVHEKKQRTTNEYNNFLNFFQKNLTGNQMPSIYIFGLQQIQGQKLDLMNYVNIVTTQINVSLSQYYVVGIEAGIQISSGRGIFAFKNFSLEIAQKESRLTMPDNCPLGAAYDQLLDQCITQQKVDEAIGSIVSIPNIDLFFKIGPFLSMLDDLSYFVYHNVQYDRNFKYISELSWNWTQSKWAPPNIITDTIGSLPFFQYYQKNDALKWLKHTTQMTPFRFQWNNEDLFFLNNCRGYLFYTVPSSVLLFFIFSKLYYALSVRKLELAKLLIAFSSWAYLIVSLLGDNLQYLSFRCFSQLRYVIPNRGILSYISIILSINIGFIAIICAICTYFLALSWTSSNFRPTLLLKRHNSCYYLMFWLVARMISGFIHAYIDDALQRITFLVLLQGVLASLSCCFVSLARYKTSLTIVVFGYIIRFLLYLVAWLEILFPELVKKSSNQDSMNQATYVLTTALLIANVIQIVLHISLGVLVTRGSNNPKSEDQTQKLQSHMTKNHTKIPKKQFQKFQKKKKTYLNKSSNNIIAPDTQQQMCKTTNHDAVDNQNQPQSNNKQKQLQPNEQNQLNISPISKKRLPNNAGEKDELVEILRYKQQRLKSIAKKNWIVSKLKEKRLEKQNKTIVIKTAAEHLKKHLTLMMND